MPLDPELERRLEAIVAQLYSLNVTVKGLVELLPAEDREQLGNLTLGQTLTDIQLGGLVSDKDEQQPQ